VTGFLGAGKTTLLNSLLRDPALSDALVIINELGETGLDHLLVERLTGDVVVMTSGCLCCTIHGDLIATLEDLLRRRDNARIAPFQRVIIETTGLADPAPILHAVMGHPYLMLRFRLADVITLIDAVNGAATLDAHEEAVKQAAMADVLVLSKTDLLEAKDGLPSLEARLKKLNPCAPVLDAAKGEVTAEALLCHGIYDPDQKIPDVRRWLNAEALSASHGHHHAGSSERERSREPQLGASRHEADIRAFCLRHEAPLQPQALDLFIEWLRKAHGPKLLRVKGIVALATDPSRPLVIQGVQHLFHPPLRLAAWPDGDHTTRIVFILRGLEPAFIDNLWQTVTGLTAPDCDADLSGRRVARLTPYVRFLIYWA
jgi:G3E family GTPase